MEVFDYLSPFTNIPFSGQYERVVNVYDASRNACLAGHAWSEQNLPVYYAKTREVVGPALDTSIDYAKVGTVVKMYLL